MTDAPSDTPLDDPETAPGEAGLAPLPGDDSPRRLLERIIRVDHAGELGAVRIYQGQRAILGKNAKLAPVLRHMEEQERRHHERFSQLIGERRVRPTILQPIWHVAGFALGAGTALLGPRAAMACTVAVEEAIDEHYQSQADALGEDEAELRETVLEFQAEEVEHRDTALAHGAQDSPAYGAITTAVKFGTKLAIWLSSRV